MILFQQRLQASLLPRVEYIRRAADELSTDEDLRNRGDRGAARTQSGTTITGANNLIGYSALPVPNDTILQQDPLLGPLAFNGGSTATHALLSGSPAIDGGNNTFNASFDQRGSGYPRVIGSAPDIGAYEFEASDVIFVNAFDP